MSFITDTWNEWFLTCIPSASNMQPNTGSVAVTGVPARRVRSSAILAWIGRTESSKSARRRRYPSRCVASALPRSSARVLASASMVAGSYQMCGLSPGFLPTRSATTMTVRSALRAAPSSFSIQAS